MPTTVVRRIPWIAAVAAILLSGCYTVIMHPKVENERKTAGELRADCIDCHADYHVYPYDPYDHFFGADYYWSNPRYGYYYGYPWWWDDYYWNYYHSPEDPSAYTGTPRQIGRPSYRGGVPARSGDLTQPRLHTGGMRRPQVGDPSEQGTDTRGGDTTVAPDTRTLGTSQRLTGQPPWSTPKGTVTAKPPSLRQGVAGDPEITPTVKSTTGSGTSVSSPPPVKPAEKSTPPKEEAKPDEKKPEQPRGRPKRNPG